MSQIQELLEKSTRMNPGWYHGWILLVESMSQLYLVVSKLMYLSSVQYRTTSDRVTHIDEFSKSQFLTPFKHLTIMISPSFLISSCTTEYDMVIPRLCLWVKTCRYCILLHELNSNNTNTTNSCYHLWTVTKIHDNRYNLMQKAHFWSFAPT